MRPAINIELILILLLIVANGVFAMSEAALISSRKARLQQRAEEGDRGAKTALKVLQDPNRFLSTIQIGITLIGILSGAFGGATLSQGVAQALRTIPALAASADALAIFLVVLFITYLSLVVGELVPKRLALNNAERIASLVARPMNILSRLTAPVIALLIFSTELLLRILGVRPSQEPPVTEEEVQFMMEEGTQAGIFEKAELSIIANLFRIGDRRVSTLMTYRSDVVWLDIDDDHLVNFDKIVTSEHLYYPVYKDEPGNALGMIAIRDILPQLIQGGTPDLHSVLFEPLYVPENTSALGTLELLRETSKQVALIINEHGDIEGLVTANDLVEAILGEFPDIDEREEDEAVQRADGSWLLDGLMNIEDLEDKLQRDVSPDDEESSYQTLGGFIMMRIGRIPTTADRFEWRGLSFEIMDMDGRRVDKVLVTVLDPEAEFTPKDKD